MNLDKIETQAFVQRMFNHYLQIGMSSQDALNMLSDKLGKPYSSAISTLENSLKKDSQSNSQLTTESFTNSLLRDVTELNGSTNQISKNAHSALQKIAPGVQSCARFFSVIFIYPAIIFGLALVVYSMYKLFVLPEMISAFSGSSLPSVTDIFFSDLSAIILLIAAILIVIFLSIQISGLLTSFSKIKPTQSILGRLTGVSEHHSYFVFLAYLKVLLESKPSATAVKLIDKADNYSHMNTFSSYTYRHHRAAVSLLSEGSNEALLEEVEFQLDDSLPRLEQAFVKRQEKLLFVFQLCIFIFVGCMINAMYMPIFKLASIF